MVQSEEILDPYGQYVLGTTTDIVERVELLYGQFWYGKYFRGLRPILDLGPGRCWFTKQAPMDIVGVDLSPSLIRHYQEQGLNLVLGDAYDLPFEDNHFQGVFCCWLYEHLEDPQRALAELYRVLAPGGLCVLVVPTPHDMEAFYTDFTHIRPFTPLSLSQLANTAGFAEHRSEYMPFVRGLNLITRRWGNDVGLRYVLFSDRTLRRFGVVNRNHVALIARKR